MTELFNIASHFIQGKPIYQPARRLLNLLLNVSISSYFYVLWFGQYQWLDVTDYKGILDFFVGGQFFLPFSIFIMVYVATETIGSGLFAALTHFWSVRNQRRLLNYSLTSEHVDIGAEIVQDFSKVVLPDELTKEKMIAFYKKYSPEITPEALQELKTVLTEPKKNLESNFTTTCRIAIALLVYAGTVEHLSGGFLIGIMVLLGLLGLFFILAYRILDILPAFFNMLKKEGDRYLALEENS